MEEEADKEEEEAGQNKEKDEKEAEEEEERSFPVLGRAFQLVYIYLGTTQCKKEL